MDTPLRPLDGTLVVDLSQNLPGPLLTRILADLGATVVKVEPKTGEGLRWMPPHVSGTGLAFGSVNAGKRSVAVDLKAPEGSALVRAILAKADVLVESFRPGVLARLGLDPAELMAEHPQLIVCSLTGYGQATPLARRAGHDVNYLARNGLLALQGPADGPPEVPMAQIADVGGGTYPAAMGVLAALLERQRTGRGRHLDIALVRGLGFDPVLLATTITGHGAPRGADMLTGGAPCYRCYATSDGQHMAIGALEPRFWQTFCALAERPDLIPRQYDPTAHDTVEALFSGRSQAEWVTLLADHDVCCEPVRTPSQALSDPELDLPHHDVAGFPIFPVHLGAPLPDPPTPPPALGADTASVCTELGIDPNLLDAARAAGALP